MKTCSMFIGGKWVDALSGATFDDMNPYSGEIYARVPKGDAGDADRAMAAADSVRTAWSAKAPQERSRLLFKAARILEESREEVAQVLIAEGGSTLGKAAFEISQTAELLRCAGSDANRILGETFHTEPAKLSMTLRRPRGTVVAISPWNFPLILSMYKVAYALQ
jgi:acyl-CoA reductase-like NAD-dependent aldehyde dehydrogenase